MLEVRGHQATPLLAKIEKIKRPQIIRKPFKPTQLLIGLLIGLKIKDQNGKPQISETTNDREKTDPTLCSANMEKC